MRISKLNTKDRLYPKTKNYYQKLVIRKIFGKKLYKFFKVLKIVLFFKTGKSFEISKFLKQVIQNEFVIFDIGANLGQYALRFSSFLRKRGKVISVEPVQENYLYLEKIKKHYKLDNLICCNYAISDYNKESILNIPIINNDIELDTRATIDLNNYYFDYSNYKKQVVEVVTLDELFNKLKLERLDILKSDTEGNDSKVILGSIELINRFLPVLLVEDSHDEMWLKELYVKDYLPFYVFKDLYLIDAHIANNYKKYVKYDLLVLIHKSKLKDFINYIVTN